MARQQRVRRTAATVSAIPDKLCFRIGEVAAICAVPSYVLRFWEREFAQLRPGKGGSGQRLYRRRDVEMVLRIKGLLYDEGYTIPGARQLLRGDRVLRPAAEPGGTDGLPPGPRLLPGMGDSEQQPGELAWIGAELRAILELLAERERAAGRTTLAKARRDGAWATGTLFDGMDDRQAGPVRVAKEGKR